MSQSNTDTGCFYSRLGGDPDLADIVEMFVEELPKRMEAIRNHLHKADWDGLRQLAHQMKGAAGSYGFDCVSPVAGKVESAIRNGEPEESIRAAVAELTELCSRVRHGTPPSRP
jgi:histidine phosphotransfer protein HptB